MKILACQNENQVPRETSLGEALDLVRNQPQALVWIDILGPVTKEHQELLSSPPFEFHELAVEDASKGGRQRTKVEEYDGYFFLVMHALTTESHKLTLTLDWREIDLFVGANFVVSVHHEALPEIDRVWKDVAERGPRILRCGSDRLTYFLLDAVVDRYIEAVDEIEDVLDELEDTVIASGSGESDVKEIFLFKRQMIGFRKKAGPLREAINEMTSRNFPFIKEDTVFYLRDVYDHLIRLSDMLDSYRDILTGALDVHLSAVSNRLNVIMKRLTIVATIFMPLAFLTGFWGMNFEQLPVRSVIWFWGSIVVMGLVALIMIIVFKTRKYQ